MSPRTGAIPDHVEGDGRTEDRGASELDTAWLIRDQAAAAPSVPVLCLDARTPVPAAAGTVALIILSDAVPATARTAESVIAAGGRVYGLAPAGWSSQQAPAWLSGAPATSVLVRRVLKPPAAAVLMGERGWIWAGPDGAGIWRLELDAGQVRAMRRAFLDLFWNFSDDEAWPADGRLQWRDRGEPPFDLPAPLSEDCVGLGAFAGTPPVPGSDGALYSADGQLPDQVPSRVWVPPSGAGQDHARLAGAVRRGGVVCWTDLGLPTCTTGRRACLRPSTERWTLTVRLTPGQEAALADVLAQPPAAEFQLGVSLSQAADLVGADGRVWRAGQHQAEKLISAQTLDAGVVAAPSLRDMATATPPSWPSPAPVALSVRYTWRVTAPRVPAGAKEDPLVRKWHAVDEDFAERLAAALVKLTAAGEQAAELAKDFPDRRGAVIGFDMTIKDVRVSLEDLQAAVPSLVGPAAARARLTRLSELEGQVTELSGQVGEATRTARAEVDRRRQQDAHAAKQEQARQELAAHELEKTRKQQRLDEIEARLGQLAANAEDQPEKDLKVARSRLRDEQNQVTSRIRNLRRLIQRATDAVDERFVYRPSAASSAAPATGRPGGRSLVPTATEPAAVGAPDEALPAVGHLLRAGSERMLAISNWAELDQGEAEAVRLRARLVASGEGA